MKMKQLQDRFYCPILFLIVAILLAIHTVKASHAPMEGTWKANKHSFSCTHLTFGWWYWCFACRKQRWGTEDDGRVSFVKREWWISLLYKTTPSSSSSFVNHLCQIINSLVFVLQYHAAADGIGELWDHRRWWMHEEEDDGRGPSGLHLHTAPQAIEEWMISQLPYFIIKSMHQCLDRRFRDASQQILS